MIIIGITGTLGAGKGTIVEFLVKKYGFIHYSVRAFLIEEIKKQKLPVNRDSMTLVANELRRNNSPSFVTDTLFELAMESGQNCIIESIRTPGEIESLKEKGNFYLFAVDADPQVRFERAVLRNSETDQIDFQTFLNNEKREFTSTDLNNQNLKKCIELADFIFINDSGIKELQTKVEQVLSALNIKQSIIYGSNQ